MKSLSTLAAVSIAAFACVALPHTSVRAQELSAGKKESAEMKEKAEPAAKEAKADEADEKEISLDEAPAAVRAAIQKEIGAEGKLTKLVKEMDEGKEAYEADFMKQGIECSVKVAPDGSVVEIEKKVSVDSLPAAVKSALKKEIGDAKVKEALAVTLHTYEFEIEKDGKTQEVKVDPLGNVELEDESAEEEKEQSEEKAEKKEMKVEKKSSTEQGEKSEEKD
ncbi:MAG: hypothetical protein ACP5QZ_03115 [Candidatus Sumerlaeaceae bacterium]|jgi:hypothetical protein